MQLTKAYVESPVGRFPPTIWAYTQPASPHNWAAITTGWALHACQPVTSPPAAAAATPGSGLAVLLCGFTGGSPTVHGGARAASRPGPRFSPTAQMVARWRRQVVLSAPAAGGDMVTKQLEPIQFWKVFDAGERLYPAQGPGYLLHLRHSSVSEGQSTVSKVSFRNSSFLKSKDPNPSSIRCPHRRADGGSPPASHHLVLTSFWLFFIKQSLLNVIGKQLSSQMQQVSKSKQQQATITKSKSNKAAREVAAAGSNLPHPQLVVG
uniref:Uncharacterized protein n=1 Tax=Oryza rufipogon TaxID=4529 RepID=A0A0E0RBH6_ORYRU